MAAQEVQSQKNSVQGSRLDAYHILQHEPIQRQLSRSPASSSSQVFARQMRDADTRIPNRQKSYSGSSRDTQMSTSTHAENRSAQRDVRTLPRKLPSSLS